MSKIKSITIKGFKSIQQLDNFKPTNLNILIGANGAGKSNFIGFFRFLSWIVNAGERFPTHVSQLGGGSNILFDGPEITKEITGHLQIDTNNGLNEYSFRLVHAPAEDTLIFTDERIRFTRTASKEPNWITFGAGHRESKLPEHRDNKTALVINNLLQRITVYQFHNTTLSSQIRSKWRTNDGRWLKENGANLGSFLYRLRDQKPMHYQRIVRLVRQALPFFHDFILDEEYGSVLLRWKEKESNKTFDVSQASDGMLRFMGLVALLAQPAEDLPDVMFIDEPELGLHPAAISLLAALIKSAATHSQIFISTQSDNLVDEFDAEHIIVVERQRRSSTFKRLEAKKLVGWLEEYRLGELWAQNVFGGRP